MTRAAVGSFFLLPEPAAAAGCFRGKRPENGKETANRLHNGMKKTLPALLVAVLLLLLSVGTGAATEAATDGVGVILYLLNQEDGPLADTTVLLQEDLNSAEAYEGETDRQGIMMIPSFPLTGFVMAVRNADNALAGLIDVTLYPGAETRIMNNPHSDSDVVSLEQLRQTSLSEHINGNAPLEIAGGADAITMYHYEVQVSEAAGGVGALFQVGAQNQMTLEGVSDGPPGAVIPEPTLPPDDDAALPSTPSPSATAEPAPPTEPPATQAPTEPPATQAPTEPPTQAPTEQPPASETPAPTAEPTKEPQPSATETQAPEPTQTSAPTESPSQTAEPSASESATPSPTEAPPSPSPTASPTTGADLVNVKLFLKGTDGAALPYYRTQLNGQVDATANGEGEAYYTNVSTNVTHELAIFTPEGQQVGTCGLRFVEGTSTSIASVSTGSTYTIDYQRGTQDVYVELVVDAGAVTPTDASAQPTFQGSTGTVTGSSSGSGSGGSSGNAGAQASEDVIGTPSTPVPAAAAAGPSLNGYFSDEAGTAIAGATIRLRNEDTKALSSAITTAEGTFTISQLPPGNYSLGALSPQGRNLGEVQFTAARGTKTRLKTSSNGTTYLSEAQDSDEVYVDLRELSNGRLDMLYAARTPMAAPAVPQEEAAAVEPAVEPPLVVEEVETTEVETPAPETNNAGLILLVAGLCAAGVITAVVLVTRHARIR